MTMTLFLLNKLRCWHPLKLRVDGVYADGVLEQDFLQLSLVHEGGSAHSFPNSPCEAALRGIVPNNLGERSARQCKREFP